MVATETKKAIKGGEFLIRETEANEIFTPEDFNEEQYYVAIRRAYWKTPEGGPARKVAESLITTLEF